MYDSIYKITGQQQKLVNLYNQIYTPELLKRQQTYSDMITRLQPSIAPALQNMSEIATMAQKSTKILESDKFLCAWKRAMEMDRRLVQNMTGALANTNFDRFVSLAQQVTLPTGAFQNLHLNLFTGYGEIIEKLTSLQENEIELILEGTDFTTEEVLEDINELKEEFSVSEQDALGNDNVLLKDKWNNFLKTHPALANLIFIMGTLIGLISGIFAINELGELVVSATQDAIVKMQGNEDIFFVKVESAKLYTEPNSHSKVITNILYAEEVTQIDSVKMWNKVIYVNSDGEEITGWIAKRNLMTYKDYQFNADELYDME